MKGSREASSAGRVGSFMAWERSEYRQVSCRRVGRPCATNSARAWSRRAPSPCLPPSNLGTADNRLASETMSLITPSRGLADQALVALGFELMRQRLVAGAHDAPVGEEYARDPAR